MNGEPAIEPLVGIGPIEAGHERQWRELWAGYLAFYGAQIASSVTDQTWRNMLGSDDVMGLAATRASQLVGFGIVVLHRGTWSCRHSAYLEDLYVRPDQRGTGIGRMIVDEVFRLAEVHDWGTIYWHTRKDNEAARMLYDTYCEADDFVRYRIVR